MRIEETIRPLYPPDPIWLVSRRDPKKRIKVPKI